MKIEKEFIVPFPGERVWAFFHDTAAVGNCLPGAELNEAGEDGALKGRFRVKLGPIAASFAGEGRVALDEAARAGMIEGAGSDRATGTRARGAAHFALAETAGGTRVTVTVDYTLAGTLAQFGRGAIVENLATRLAGEFAANLERALSAETSVAPAAAPPISAGKLISGAIRDRLRRRRKTGEC
ncbi:MAG TPA: SRPBCC family protein [Stellaceae bacterium]|nr:SRPBCC family protein [Stellaceae bacterium]